MAAALLAVPLRTASAEAPRLPPAYDDGVRFAQIFDFHVPDRSVLIGTRPVVWDSSAPQLGVFTSYYITFIREMDRARTLAWYKANRPDWIAYGCDQATPTALSGYYPASEGYGANGPGFAPVSLDFANPEVRAYMLDSVILPAIRRGFDAIAFDNVGFDNYGDHATHTATEQCGHFTGSSYGPDGKRLRGSWVRQYSGEPYDPVFTKAVQDYVDWMHTRINAAGAALISNTSFYPVHGPEEALRLAELSDVWLLEDAHLHTDAGRGCSHTVQDGAWLKLFEALQRFTPGHAYIQSDEACPADDITRAPRADIAWSVGNFLLIKGPRSYLSASETGHYIAYSAAWTPRVGHANAPAIPLGDVFQRAYSRGLATVNPSSTRSADYVVPVGQWTDQFGDEVRPGVRTLKPSSAEILVAR